MFRVGSRLSATYVSKWAIITRKIQLKTLHSFGPIHFGLNSHHLIQYFLGSQYAFSD